MKFLPVMRKALFAPLTAAVGTVRTGLAIMGRSAALVLLFVSAAQPALAQSQTPVVIDCLPPWEANGRFLDTTLVKHPSLSLNGFDCGSNCGIGYGLKQVLEKVYGGNQEEEVKIVFRAMVDLAKENFQDTTSFNNIRDNTARLQARGFVALAAYVLENNDYDPTTLHPALPSAKQAAGNFTAALVGGKWRLRASQENDGVKWATPVTNVARAIDFYLALENAYKHYDIIEDNYNIITSTRIVLLSDLNKIILMGNYLDLIQNLEEIANLISEMDVPYIIEEIARIAGQRALRYGLEPGNVSLKMQVAIGYAALTWQQQNITDHLFVNPNNALDRDMYIRRAFRAAGEPAGNDRYRYWGYQSDDGKFFWAEGPYYFHLTLSQIIPFWHAARINDMLENTNVHPHSFADPFGKKNMPGQDWFLKPLHWLADISTPDGKTPPLDDGNKINMYNASVLRWTDDYGDPTIGEKFAWIGKTASRAWLYPVEIAIPRQERPTLNPLPEIVGNTFQDKTAGENGRQEVVVRKTIDKKEHYILLNGESGDAIVRGEGHEQGDQMQLLYYVDDISYLIDSGYDKPVIPGDLAEILKPHTWWGRSTWNNYSDHNVMWMLAGALPPSESDRHFGIAPPAFSLNDSRVASDHQSVDRIYRSSGGNIHHLSADMRLKSYDELGNYIPFAHYIRNVLFIADEDHPYLIDVNGIANIAVSIFPTAYGMTYRGNSNNVTIEEENGKKGIVWNNLHKSEGSTNPTPSNNKLFIQPFVFESPWSDTLKTITIREAYVQNQERGDGIDVKMLELGSRSLERDYSTVAFIQALPSGDNIPDLVKPNIISDNPDLDWQYYTWQRDTSTVDVFAIRQARNFLASTTDPDSSLIIVRQAGSAPFYMPGDKNFGFVRLTKNKTSGGWDIDQNYFFNLVPTMLPPLAVAVSGPDCLDSESTTGRFVASPSGGVSSYLYSWSSYRICDRARAPECNAWNGDVGVTQAVDYGGYGGDDFKIRVQVTDSSSPGQSVTSGELQVRVLSSTEGSCPSNDPSDPPGKKSPADTEETLSLDADLLEADQDIPEAYALRQNFPNPFNPSTEIFFDLPEDAMVSLVVYDVLGREVARLVHEELRAGTHRARFDAGNLPSGIYFYRIQAGDFHSTHRMTLLK